MHDGPKIIAGLVIFLVLITFPVWYNVVNGKAAYVPEIVVQTADEAGRDQCMRDGETMRATHMDVLNQWRDEVVRQGGRYITTENGQQYEMSLSNTCMDCHSNKDTFCDRCHDYLNVEPYCWECHIEPSLMPTQEGH